MNIKAYSFEHNSHSLAEVKRTVADQLTYPGVYFESFSDAKELFAEINEIIDDADVILIGVEAKAYLKFKPIFIKAFGYTPAYSEKIINLVSADISDDKVQKAHAYIPDEAEVLLTSNGAYSGFYINENNQYIVVFPLMESELPKMLAVEALDFIKPIEDTNELMDAIIDTEQSSNKASTIIGKLKKYDLRLAIPSTPSAKALKSDLKSCDDADVYVFFTPFVNDAGVSDPKQYTADLCKGARELRSTEIGATISNIFREKKGDKVIGYYSYVGVATADKIVVKKLFADPDENIENLVLEATTELYGMIDKYIDEISFKLTASNEEVEKYENSLIEAEVVSDVRPEASVSKTGIIAAIVAIVLAVALCLFITFRYGNVFVTPMDAPQNENLQPANPVATTPATASPNTTRDYADIITIGGSETETETATGEFDIPTTLPEGINTSDQNPGGGGQYRPQNNTTTTQAPTEAPTQAPTETTTAWEGDEGSF